MDTGPSETMEATAADIMSLWSPPCSTLPPRSLETPLITHPSSVPSTSAPRARSILSTDAILSLSLNLSCGAPWSLLTPSAVLRRTATIGNRSGMSDMSTSTAFGLPVRRQDKTPPSARTSHPHERRTSAILLSPWGSSMSSPSTEASPPRAPATSGNAADEKSDGTR